MKRLVLLLFLFITPVSAQEIYNININHFCADIVNIPYASDNFTDEEWKQFIGCIQLLKEYEVP